MTYITLNLSRDSVNDGSIIVYKPTSMSMDLLISWSQDIVEVLEKSAPDGLCCMLYDLSHPGVSMQFLVLTNRDVYKPGFTHLGFARVEQILEKHPQFTIKLAIVLSNKGTGELASRYVRDFEHPSIQSKLFFDREKALGWLVAIPLAANVASSPTRQLDLNLSRSILSSHSGDASQPFLDRKEIAVLVDDSLEYLALDEDLSTIMGRNSLHLETYGAKANTVSRQHARLHIEDSALYITDLGSTNGTYVNGELLEPLKPHRLKRDDHLNLGAISMQVVFR